MTTGRQTEVSVAGMILMNAVVRALCEQGLNAQEAELLAEAEEADGLPGQCVIWHIPGVQQQGGSDWVEESDAAGTGEA